MRSAKIAKTGIAQAALALAVVAPVPLCAQDQAQANGLASASVVRPISAVQQSELAFGTITVGPGGGTATMAADGAAAVFAGEVRAGCTAGPACAAHPAQFRVTGEPGYAYRIALPQTVTARGQVTGQLLDVVDLAAHDPGHTGPVGGGQLDAAGSGAFSVGGTLLVPPGTVPDQYSADLPVNVTYD